MEVSIQVELLQSTFNLSVSFLGRVPVAGSTAKALECLAVKVPFCCRLQAGTWFGWIEKCANELLALSFR